MFVDGERCDVADLQLNRVVRCGEWVAVVEPCAAEEGNGELGIESIPGEFWNSARLRRELVALRQTAASSVPILILGETGTGKNALAQLIHKWSGRPGSLHVLDCAALSPTLAEAALFGHVRGAFTGAVRDELGLLRQADGGTLYIDEIADLPAPLQARLLRFADTGEVVPVGATEAIPLDVRIISSIRALPESTGEPAVRADLLGRLQCATVSLPPLRERIADIPPLFELFVREAMGGARLSMSAQLIESVCLHGWPRNIRELRNVARLLALRFGHESLLEKQHLMQVLKSHRVLSEPSVTASNKPRTEQLDPRNPNREEREVALLREYFRDDGTSVAAASRATGIGRQRIYTLLSRYPELTHLRSSAPEQPRNS